MDRQIATDPTIVGISRPCIYEGIHFDSQYRARWAWVLDQLMIRWLHRPEIPNFGYRPEFFLPDLNCYFDVTTRQSYSPSRLRAARQMAIAAGDKDVFLSFGEVGMFEMGGGYYWAGDDESKTPQKGCRFHGFMNMRDQIDWVICPNDNRSINTEAERVLDEIYTAAALMSFFDEEHEDQPVPSTPIPVTPEENDKINLIRKVMSDIVKERYRQDTKWGVQNHNPYIYLTILMEEVGELSQAILHTQYGGDKGGPINVRKEAIHTAAVAMAMIECLDRGLWYDEDVCLKHAMEIRDE